LGKVKVITMNLKLRKILKTWGCQW